MNKLVIFDIDGTIFDTKCGIIAALNYVLKKYGINKIDIQNEDQYIGPAIKDSLIKYNSFSNDDANKATHLYREIYIKKYIGKSKPYDSLIDVFAELKKRGFELAIATMKTKSQVDKLLDIFNITDFFSVIKVASEGGGYSKKQMLLDICKKYNNDFDKIYMVGDTQGDYEAARDAGCYFIAAEYGYGEIIPNTKIIYIEKFRDLLNILI